MRGEEVICGAVDAGVGCIYINMTEILSLEFFKSDVCSKGNPLRNIARRKVSA